MQKSTLTTCRRPHDPIINRNLPAQASHQASWRPRCAICRCQLAQRWNYPTHQAPLSLIYGCSLTCSHMKAFIVLPGTCHAISQLLAPKSSMPCSGQTQQLTFTVLATKCSLPNPEAWRRNSSSVQYTCTLLHPPAMLWLGTNVHPCASKMKRMGRSSTSCCVCTKVTQQDGGCWLALLLNTSQRKGTSRVGIVYTIGKHHCWQKRCICTS